MNNKIYAIVMAGGKGTRFWPESTSRHPKQYLSLVGDQSLLGSSLSRFEGCIDMEHRYVVTTKDQEQLALKASKGICQEHSLIFEPCGRNTGPAILFSLANLELKGAGREDVVVVTPSDHVILNQIAFRETIEKSVQLAREQEVIVTIGIEPTTPHTGYGYIQRGESLDAGYRVQAFKEKPNLEVAKSFLSEGGYYWNAGMFVGKIGTLLEEFEKHAPEMFSFYGKLVSGKFDVYQDIPAESIDYAVMEKSTRIAVVPALFDWSDLGSWDALEEVIEQTNGNTVINTEVIYQKESSGNIIFSPNKKVVLHGLKDYIVVANDDVVMIMPKSEAQEVKKVVEHLKNDGNNSDLI